MLFILLTIFYIFIIYISFFGNVEERKLKKQSDDWKKIFGRDYYG